MGLLGPPWPVCCMDYQYAVLFYTTSRFLPCTRCSCTLFLCVSTLASNPSSCEYLEVFTLHTDHAELHLSYLTTEEDLSLYLWVINLNVLTPLGATWLAVAWYRCSLHYQLSEGFVCFPIHPASGFHVGPSYPLISGGDQDSTQRKPNTAVVSLLNKFV